MRETDIDRLYGPTKALFDKAWTLNRGCGGRGGAAATEVTRRGELANLVTLASERYGQPIRVVGAQRAFLRAIRPS